MTPLPHVLTLVASFYVPSTLIDLTTPVATQFPTELIDTPMATATDIEVGLSVYGASLVALTAWESLAVPRLKRRGLFPDVPTLPGMLSEKEKMEPFVTPLTADRYVPPPALEQLKTMPRYLVGQRGRVAHFITADTDGLTVVPNVCEVSEAWSDFYGVPIGIMKAVVL